MKIDHEYYLVSSMMRDNYSLHQGLNSLSGEDFENFDAKEIFLACRDVCGRGLSVDRLKVALELDSKKELAKIGGKEKLSDIAALGVSTIDADYHIAEVKKRSIKKRFVYLAEEYSHKIQEQKEPEALIEEFILEVNKITSGPGSSFFHISDIMNNFYKGMTLHAYFTESREKVSCGLDPFDGFRSGYAQLDSIISGFERGTTNIIGARSSSGKTTFFVNLFLNIREKYPEANIGFFSLEMPKRRILEKIIAAYAGIDFKKIRDHSMTQVEFDTFLAAANALKKSFNLSICDMAGIPINQLKAKTRKEVIRNKIDVLFIDYLSLIQSGKQFNNKHMDIDYVSKGLQSLALELNIPIITLAQLNRQIYGRTDKKPVLSDLRESGSIEEDADTVIMLHRPKHYDSSLINDFTEIYVAKNRIGGDLGKTSYEFHAGRLFELEPVEKMQPGRMINPDEDRYEKRL